MTKSLKHEEYTYKGRRVILDTCELFPNCYETMLMLSSTGYEYDSANTTTEAEALAAHEAIRAAHLPDCEQPKPAAPKPLTGKYAKLRDDLKKALAAGRAAEAANPDDGGTCNFDSPSIRLYRWNRAKVEQAAKEAGSGCFTWNLFGSIHYVFSPDTRAQGLARSINSEAATKALIEMGYDACEYCQAD